MPQMCCVPKCRTIQKKGSGYSFHGFPKNEETRQKWLNAIAVTNLNLNTRPRICSKHFEPTDFVIGGNIKKLSKFAVPNINLKDNRKSSKENAKQINIEKTQLKQLSTLQMHVEKIQLKQLSTSQHLLDIDNLCKNDTDIYYYTGFQSYAILQTIFQFILPDITKIDICRDRSCKTIKNNLSKLPAKNQFILTLIRLRRGLCIDTLADLFAISKSTVDIIFLSWINLMYLRLGSMHVWPNRDTLIGSVSDCMKENFPNVIGSIDCAEFFTQRPPSSFNQKQLNSNNKSAALKSLIMTDPAGAIIYTSPLFIGSISDRGILESSGFINILREKVEKNEIRPGDVILADKGFNAHDLFRSINLDLNIPVFRISGTRCVKVATCRKVAQERIHVERAIRGAIGRLRTYGLLSAKIPVSCLGSISKIYTVCILLCNFKHALIK